ncbi:MAG: rod shape-determining protein RodA [Deltaproteobacteria bacterium]|nr:MAG: rod shape-determining protein RodA [Deltaproteobacteria bacterium]
MIDRRLIQNFDWLLLLLACAIVATGLVILYSAVSSGGKAHSGILMRQIYWLGIGFVAMALAFSLDYQWLERFAYPLYIGGLLLLVAVLVHGKTVSGSKRWLDLGLVVAQPSELMKPLLVIALARYFARQEKRDGYRIRDLGLPAIIVVIPVLLVLLEPDLGTAMILLIISVSVVLFVGVQPFSLLVLAGCSLGSLPLLWFLMKGYQRQRILTLIEPSRDPLGAGYHIIQSKIAVGSGQFWGKGFLEGTQSQLRFIPEHHTDFIFSVLAEEWGFLGSILLLGLFLCLLLRGLSLARRSRDHFGALLGFGITVILFWHVAVNIGMVLGMLPVVGIPLPLVSYGGSSAVVTMASIGILLNVGMRKFVFQK